ncbi:MAG TPA: hypothetical protein VE439_07630 [Anaerolineae bacterium]|nr:hypothetical protein [Anaerolineae bacterium]
MEDRLPTLNRNINGVIASIIISSLLLSSVFLQAGIDTKRSRLGLMTTGVKSTVDTAAQFLGGLRSAVAAVLWIKVDRVHHAYFEERGAGLENEDELIPLYRLVTWLDPHIYEAYYVGSYMLYLFDRPDEGWKFALEGLHMNPEVARMEFNVGYLALIKRNDYKYAIPHLEQAYSLAQDDEDRFYVLSNLVVAYSKAGMAEKAEDAKEKLSKIANSPTASGENDEHEHEHEEEHDKQPKFSW